jgi:hypothetical protein
MSTDALRSRQDLSLNVADVLVSWDIVVSMEARVKTGRSRVQIPVGVTNLFLYKSCPFSLAPIASCCSSPRSESLFR